jgi:hypothetical protein
MKKSVLLMVVLALTLANSCTTYWYSASVSVINYSIFTERGFFITESNSVSFEYEPVGSLYVSVYSGIVSKQLLIEKSNDNVYPDKYSGGKWKKADVNDALELFYKKALENGANGVIALKNNLRATNIRTW